MSYDGLDSTRRRTRKIFKISLDSKSNHSNVCQSKLICLRNQTSFHENHCHPGARIAEIAQAKNGEKKLMVATHEIVLRRIEDLYRMLFSHTGYGEMAIEIRYLRKNEKEVLIRCGRQYRYIVPFEKEEEKCGATADNSLAAE